jgi:hypothetical protein
MKKTLIITGACMALSIMGCDFSPKKFVKGLGKTVLKEPPAGSGTKVIFLHHSTGQNIWNGGVEQWFEEYNASSEHKIHVVEQAFPASAPYGWHNYPCDYWNIWVKNAGAKPYKKEPTLEMLTDKYDIVVFKHCFPVCKIKEDTGNPDISSSEKRVENYKLQYEALKKKMSEFPNTRFIVWTGAALVEAATTQAEAERARTFFEWVKNEWDQPDDNIFIWDFYELETEGGLYLKPEYAKGPRDSHPNEMFSAKAASELSKAIIEVGTGEKVSENGSASD